MLGVGVDDPLHEAVTDDVVAAEGAELDEGAELSDDAAPAGQVASADAASSGFAPRYLDRQARAREEAAARRAPSAERAARGVVSNTQRPPWSP